MTSRDNLRLSDEEEPTVTEEELAIKGVEYVLNGEGPVVKGEKSVVTGGESVILLEMLSYARRCQNKAEQTSGVLLNIDSQNIGMGLNNSADRAVHDNGAGNERNNWTVYDNSTEHGQNNGAVPNKGAECGLNWGVGCGNSAGHSHNDGALHCNKAQYDSSAWDICTSIITHNNGAWHDYSADRDTNPNIGSERDRDFFGSVLSVTVEKMERARGSSPVEAVSIATASLLDNTGAAERELKRVAIQVKSSLTYFDNLS